MNMALVCDSLAGVPQKKVILLIEDEPDLRQAIRLRLENAGYSVIEAEDGAIGLTAARAQHPDIILLDVMMPKLDGFHVAQSLKNDPRYNHIPIIMLTVKSQQTDIDAGMAAGADAYLTKPYQPHDLLGTISSFVA